ncbi:MAG: protein translocase subunit SecD [Clostridia bacterium]|nr:protein translocase subunit SecD [Clostridia bacterium]
MKAKSILGLVVTILLIALLLFTAIFGLTITNPITGEKYYFPKALDENYGVKRGLDLVGGSIISFEADTDNPSAQDMNAVSAVMRNRLDSQGYYDATVAIRGTDTVVIEIPSISNPEDAVQMLGATAKLTFRDSDGNVLMEGGTDVKSAAYRYGQTSENGNMQHYVELSLTPEGTKKFTEATTTISQKASGSNYIAIYLDEEMISQPQVSEPISQDTCIISGSFTEASASALANQIQSGQLPFGLKESELRSIGPTLGDKALETSLLAAGIGILLVMIFMLLFYRVSGLVAVIALSGYISLVILTVSGYFSFLGVSGTLTLPGIAGIVLSVGMAVDANIVIFERIKEELRAGKTARAAVDSGFRNALTAIIDSNVTTIIAAIVLGMFGTGTIKGFAWTLAIGIVISMITAVFVTKYIMKLFLNLGLKKPSAFGVKVAKEVQ